MEIHHNFSVNKKFVKRNNSLVLALLSGNNPMKAAADSLL
jgi:hypothetical protein